MIIPSLPSLTTRVYSLKPRPWNYLISLSISLLATLLFAYTLPPATMKTFLFSMMLALVFFAAWKHWQNGLRLKIGLGIVSIKTPIELAFPISNIARVSLDPKGTLRLTLYDETDSAPVTMKQRLQENFRRFGWNLEIAGLSMATAREVCKALHLVPEVISSEIAANVSSNRMESYHQILLKKQPNIPATWILLAANIGYFVWTSYQGVSPWQPDVKSLLDWGANFAPLTSNGQPWRLLACAFLHVGVVHLLMNMFVLWRLGPLLERMLGSVPFTVTWFLSAIAGSEASLYWNEFGVSAGASGALFGIIGCLLGYILGKPRSVPSEVLRQFRSITLALLLINFLFMAFLEGIDQAAHAGGALMGIACGIFLSLPDGRHPVFSFFLRNIGLAVLGGWFLFACWLPVQAKSARDSALLGQMEQFQKNESVLLESLNQYRREHSEGKLTRLKMAELVAGGLLPRWQEFDTWFSHPEKVPPTMETWFPQFQKYIAKRVEAHTTLVEGLTKGNPFLIQKAHLLNQEADRIVSQINEDLSKKK